MGEYTVPSLRRFNLPLFTTLSGTSTISLSPSNAPKQTNWAEAPPLPSRNHPGPVHSAPIVPSTDMSEGFPALTDALHHSFASVMAHLCLAQPTINSSAVCSPKRGIEARSTTPIASALGLPLQQQWLAFQVESSSDWVDGEAAQSTCTFAQCSTPQLGSQTPPVLC